MRIEGERIVLRPILPSDFPALVKWTKDPEVGHYMEDDGYPETLMDCQEWYQKQRSNRRLRRLVITTRDGLPIGDIELDHITWRSGDAELRIRIGESEYRGKGYGAESVLTLLSYAFDEMKLSRIYLRVSSANQAAIRCYEKVGFKKEGKLVRTWGSQDFREIYLMRILKEEFRKLYPHSRQLAG
ncbi:MAG TPA: GNAT family N-acetyltransferase [Firmicutes bacterium]|nr:GNAT family N-acetyltransferase [Bacillota bacterium]